MAWIVGGAIAGGAILSSMSADKASDSQSSASGKAIDETRREYETSRADLAPYRQAGQAALGRLRDLLGLNSPSVATSGYIAQDRFDPNAYLQANPDVAADAHFGQNPYDHYLQYGIKEGRQGYMTQPGDATSSPLLRKFNQADLEEDPVYQNGLKFGLDEGTKALERRAASAGGYDSGAALKALTRFGTDYGSTKAGESYGRFRDVQDAIYGKLSGVAGLGSGATSVGVGANSAEASNLSNLYTGQGNASAAGSIAKGNAISGGVNNALMYNYLSQLSPGSQRGGLQSVLPPGASDLNLSAVA